VNTTLTTCKCWHIDAVGAAVALAFTAVLGLGGFWPLVRDHQEHLAQKGQLASQKEQAARLESALASLQARLAAARQSLAENPLQLKAAANINRQLADISALAADTGLRIDDMRPDRSVPGAHYETVPVVVAGGGTYRTCSAFLGRLRRAMPDTAVSSLELAAGGGDPAAPGKFRFDLLWHAAPATAAAPAK
jgi:Tfp pilus assembly protein PilO